MRYQVVEGSLMPSKNEKDLEYVASNMVNIYGKHGDMYSDIGSVLEEYPYLDVDILALMWMAVDGCAGNLNKEKTSYMPTDLEMVGLCVLACTLYIIQI